MVVGHARGAMLVYKTKSDRAIGWSMNMDEMRDDYMPFFQFFILCFFAFFISSCAITNVSVRLPPCLTACLPAHLLAAHNGFHDNTYTCHYETGAQAPILYPGQFSHFFKKTTVGGEPPFYRPGSPQTRVYDKGAPVFFCGWFRILGAEHMS